jgi:predicted small lipoprotein YifL
MKKILLVLLALITLFTLTACGKKEIEEPKKENNETSQKENIDINNGEENNKQEENNQNNNVYNNDDEIIEYDDAENTPPEEPVVVEKIINCDGCVFAYLDGSTQTKYLGSTITESEYTTDIKNLRTKGGKQRRNFFGFVLSDNVFVSFSNSCLFKII